MASFRDDFAGYEEPDIYEILEYARPYLPRDGAFGEMVLNVGKVVYLAKKGADGSRSDCVPSQQNFRIGIPHGPAQP